MDRTVIPGDCARLITQLAHLWHRSHPRVERPDAPATLDTEITEVVQELVKFVAPDLDGAATRGASPNPPDALVKLTRRERDVLHWLAKGKTVEDVSSLMHISKCTVRTYIQRTLRKLDVSNRTHAVTRALRFGLIEL